MGFIFGFYNPIQYRWRNKDCRARFMSMVQNLMNYVPYADQPFEGGPIRYLSLAISVSSSGFGIYKTMDRCQY